MARPLDIAFVPCQHPKREGSVDTQFEFWSLELGGASSEPVPSGHQGSFCTCEESDGKVSFLLFQHRVAVGGRWSSVRNRIPELGLGIAPAVFEDSCLSTPSESSRSRALRALEQLIHERREYGGRLDVCLSGGDTTGLVAMHDFPLNSLTIRGGS